MPTVAFGTTHSTLPEPRFIPKLTSRSLNYARVFAFVCAGMGMLLTGCGGGGGGGTDDNPGSTMGNAVKGPVIGGDVEITDANGLTVASLSTGEDSRFSVDIPENVAYPLIVKIMGGTDAITGETPAIELRSAILEPGQHTVTATPFTTLIVAAAEHSDQGLSVESIRSAQTMFMENPYGLPPELAANPLHTPINDQNVAELIQGSEAITEVLRRTSKSLGMPMSAVIKTLAADLVDGSINGQGAAGTDPEVAVVTNTTTAQVLVQSLAGNLTVNGNPFDATALSNAASIMFPGGTAALRTAAIAPNEAVLQQASMATDVALAVDADVRLAALRSALNAVTASDEPQTEAIQEALNAEGTTVENVSTAAGEATRSALRLSNAEIANANAVVDKWFPVAETHDSEPGRVADNTPPNSEPTPPRDNVPPPSDPSTPIADTEPRANPDAATVEQGVLSLIDMLGNDKGLENAPLSVEITGPPEKGTARITAGRQMSYQSRKDTLGSDNVTYRIEDADGDTALGSVDITITCSEPPCDRTFSGVWSRVPDATGYCLYHRNETGQRQNVPFEGHPSDHPLGDSNNQNQRVCVGNVTSFNWRLPVHNGRDIFAITTVVRDVESEFSKEAEVVSFK